MTFTDYILGCSFPAITIISVTLSSFCHTINALLHFIYARYGWFCYTNSKIRFSDDWSLSLHYCSSSQSFLCTVFFFSHFILHSKISSRVYMRMDSLNFNISICFNCFAKLSLFQNYHNYYLTLFSHCIKLDKFLN